MTWLHLIGGGVSNLHLAHQLVQTPFLPGKVVISEPNPEPLAGKTLCGFWPAKEPLAIKPNHRWQQWGFSQAGQQVNHLAQHWTYCRYAGPDFARQVRDLLEAHPQILWRQEALTERPKARWVMDSRPPSMEQFQAYQSFVGFEVDSVQGETLGLMEDLRCEDHGISFVYRLPMGQRTLIELTRFEPTPTPLDQLEQRLRLMVGNRQIHYREAAVIPMGVRCDDHWGIPVGARGGFARASTGYSFFASQRWAVRAAQDLLNDRVPTGPYTALENWMDQVFLRLLRNHPERLAKALFVIAQRMAPDHFAAFMAGGSVSACLRMMRAAPPKPFIQAALKWA